MFHEHANLPSFQNKMKKMKKTFPSENFIYGWCVGYGCESRILIHLNILKFTRSHFAYDIWCFLNKFNYQMIIYVYLLNFFHICLVYSNNFVLV
jgi:hypothetical protein